MTNRGRSVKNVPKLRDVIHGRPLTVIIMTKFDCSSMWLNVPSVWSKSIAQFTWVKGARARIFTLDRGFLTECVFAA